MSHLSHKTSMYMLCPNTYNLLAQNHFLKCPSILILHQHYRYTTPGASRAHTEVSLSSIILQRHQEGLGNKINVPCLLNQILTDIYLCPLNPENSFTQHTFLYLIYNQLHIIPYISTEKVKEFSEYVTCNSIQKSFL